MSRSAVFVASILISFVFISQAPGFGTIAGLGQNREHERITRHALSCTFAHGMANCFETKSTDEVAGQSHTFGAVGAPDNPLRGLLSSSAAHCDNGDYLAIPGYAHSAIAAQVTLETCRAWMEQHMNGAVTAARALVVNGAIDDSEIPTIISCTYLGSPGRAKCNVLEEFGLVLHASEDFYSHTNWTDLPDISVPIGPHNPPGLGNTAPAPWLNLRNLHPVFPPGLISGCFESIPEFLYCNAGPGGRVKHEFLNKDKGTIDPTIGGPNTPRGLVSGNFQRSVEAAIADTRDKWLILQERLIARYGARDGNLMICAITHDDPATTCGGQQQSSRSIFDLFVNIGLFVGAAGLLGGGFYLVGRGRRREPA